MTIDDYYAQLLDAECGWGVKCQVYNNQADCESVFKPQLDLSLTQTNASITAGRVAYHGDKATACLDAIKAKLTCKFTDSLNSAAADPCNAAFEPKVDAGGQCYKDGECKSLACQLPSGCNPGTCCLGHCAAALAKLGESCTSLPCAKGAYCSAAELCAPLVPAGGVCDAADACQPPTYCIAPDPLAAQGTCEQLPDLGQPCDFFCDRWDNYCNFDPVTGNGVCAQVLAVGQSCSDTFECAYYATCSSAGSCAANIPGVGDPCVSLYDCLYGLYCDEFAGICKVPLGQVCG
ncbi:MAG TPA: hypothetical protein VGX03_07525 [Candidatus Binatia bacterium]|nr:hypothetical protein [Candidatus Binatia bacterium]